MHIPDGFLSAPVAAAAWALGAASLAAALRHDRRESAAIPAGVLGSLSAFLFAAQMVNVPVAPAPAATSWAPRWRPSWSDHGGR
jgi:cobalt/nickel transport system permease protein